MTSEVRKVASVRSNERIATIDNGIIDLLVAEEDTDSDVVLTSMSGQLVGKHSLAKGQTSARINVQQMATGIYNVSLQRGGQVMKSQKVLVK